VPKCEQLCYSLAEREFATVKIYSKPSYGFTAPLTGKDIFFHNDSIYGERRFKIGDMVWFARHAGGGSDQAFPLLKVRSNE
jgi:eukaryotic-like serine/threonine-protein kinase